MAETSFLIGLTYGLCYFFFMVMASIQSWFDYRHKYATDIQNATCFKQLKWWGKALWGKRRMYAPILVHLFDTASDIGVLATWYLLAVKESNGEYNVEG